METDKQPPYGLAILYLQIMYNLELMVFLCFHTLFKAVFSINYFYFPTDLLTQNLEDWKPETE